MLVRRYGDRIHAVRPRFDAHALTEVAFERLDASWPADDWLAGHERVGEHLLTAEAEGDVKAATEEALLRELRDRVQTTLDRLSEGLVALVENGPREQAKTRDTTREIPGPAGVRLHFSWRVEPPLRIGVYRPRTSP